MNVVPILIPFLLAAGWFPAQQEILGRVTRDEIFAQCPGWPAVAAAYSPSPEAVERLRAVSREVLVEVFLGSWCDDSKSHVSEFLKVLELADTPLIRAEYIGIPEDKAKRPSYYQGKDIVKIPTFIVLIDGVEKGRIVEAPVKSIEDDLVRIITP
jgi:thiol-disulfide isomerase/thioredoxin